MFINSKDISGALSRIAAIASLDKQQPGILFDIKDDCVDVYYNSVQKAIINTIPAVVSDEDIKGKVVFDYKKLTETINYCIGSGKIIVDNIEFKLSKNPDGTGTATIYVIKKMEMDNGQGENESIVVSTNSYDLSWWDAEHLSLKQKILNNPACDNMFNDDNSFIWDSSEICRVLTDTCTGDAKVVYMSPKYNGAFAVNTNSNVYVRAKSNVDRVIQLQSSAVKAIVSVLSGYDADEVHINTINSADGNLFACLFFTSDNKLSIYMGAAALSKPNLVTMARYTGYDYKSYQANIYTDAIKDTLKSAVNLNASPDGTITFVRNEEGTIDAVITAVDTGKSTSNTYRIKCRTFNTLKELPEIDETILKVNVDLRLLSDIISNNRSSVTGLDITDTDNGIFLRISFLDLEKATEAREVYKKEHEIDGKLSIEDKLNLRDDYISTCYYVTVKK